MENSPSLFLAQIFYLIIKSTPKTSHAFDSMDVGQSLLSRVVAVVT